MTTNQRIKQKQDEILSHIPLFYRPSIKKDLEILVILGQIKAYKEWKNGHKQNK